MGFFRPSKTASKGKLMGFSNPVVLLDSPDDGYCESFGWVTTDVSETDARFLLKDFCADADGDPPYVPQGPATKVLLAPVEKGPFVDEWRWHYVEVDHPEAQEFWEIDVTE